MSFGNFYLFKSHEWIKYVFYMENGFEDVYGKDWKLWRYTFVFCEIGNMKKYLALVYMTHVNRYKLEKYCPSQ